MNKQKSQLALVFNADASRRAREASIRQVADAASPDWKQAALNAIRYVAERRAEFTTDAVWYVMQQRGISVPEEPRAMGPVMRVAVTMGLCDPTDRTHKSERVSCHRRPLRVWRSRLCVENLV